MPTMEINTDVEITITCRECGRDLAGEANVNGTDIKIEPCPFCMQSRYEDGQDDGRTEIELRDRGQL